MAQDPIAKVKECFAARHDRVSPELPAHKASIEITASNKGKIVHIYILYYIYIYDIYMYIHWFSTIHMNKKTDFDLTHLHMWPLSISHVLPITYGTFTEHSIGLNPWAPPHPMKYPIYKYHTYI